MVSLPRLRVSINGQSGCIPTGCCAGWRYSIKGGAEVLLRVFELLILGCISET